MGDGASEAPQEISPRRGRSGSAARKQEKVIGLRVTLDYYGLLDVAAQAKGLFVPSYVREFLPPEPGVAPKRRASLDAALHAGLLGAVNRMGNCLHQLLKWERFGTVRDVGEVREILLGYESDYRKMTAAILGAMGRDRE